MGRLVATLIGMAMWAALAYAVWPSPWTWVFVFLAAAVLVAEVIRDR